MNNFYMVSDYNLVMKLQPEQTDFAEPLTTYQNILNIAAKSSGRYRVLLSQVSALIFVYSNVERYFQVMAVLMHAHM